ncbi:MAG: DUF3786 domain-containing protein [Thermodesulfobacteriota bacterium]
METRFEQFETIYADYLSRIRDLDLKQKSRIVGGEMNQSELVLPLLGREFRISPEYLLDSRGRRPLHAEVVILCQYLLLSPQEPVQYGGEWVSFRDFKDAAPFAGAFVTNVEQNIVNHFQGRLDSLRLASEKLQGYEPDTGLSYDLIRVFPALPRMDVMLLFNDMDEEFPAECKVLFPETANMYLDMECLAMIGWLLADYLRLQAGAQEMSIM